MAQPPFKVEPEQPSAYSRMRHSGNYEEIIDHATSVYEDIQTFTGEEYDETPGLVIGNLPGVPAVYQNAEHDVAVDIALPSKEDYERVRSLIVEEYAHALQADGRRENSGEPVVMESWDTEGFAHWTADHLTDFSMKDYREEQLESLEELVDNSRVGVESIEQIPEFLREEGKYEESGFQRHIEAYAGLSYFEAFNNENGFDATVQEALRPKDGELDNMLETIEDSTIEPVYFDELIRPHFEDLQESGETTAPEIPEKEEEEQEEEEESGGFFSRFL